MPTLPEASSLLTIPSHGVVSSVRAPQVELARNIAHALRSDTGLAAEAGTGVGKTKAYVVQSVEHLLSLPDDLFVRQTIEDEDGDGEERVVYRQPTVVIATATKALQSQIVDRELPEVIAGVVHRMRADGASEDEISAALDKLRFAKKVGKKNHLCYRLVDKVAKVNPEVRKQLPIYDDFCDRVPGWIMSDAPESHPLPADAHRFGVSYCNPDTCKFEDACSESGYLAAKTAADEASILVTNHALVTADLVLRRREYRPVLSERITAVVLDEAHRFPDTLRAALTVVFSAELWTKAVQSYAQLRYELESSKISMVPALPGIVRVRSTCEAFLRDAAEEPVDAARTYRAALSAAIDDVIGATGCPDLETLKKRAASASETSTIGAYYRELCSYAASLEVHHGALAMLCDDAEMRGRYILATTKSERVGDPPVRTLVPITLAGSWGGYLSELDAAPIYVSATLATGLDADAPFAPFLNEMGKSYRGLPVNTFMADSPFDYAKQAVLYTPLRSAPAAGDPESYARELVAATRPLLLANEGHAFVLFTSRLDLRAYEAALGESDYPYPILSQDSSEHVRTRGASLFKKTPNATLLGLKTFFEGVDIPGLGLSLVIIPKLPFKVPDAASQAKRARYDEGYTGFMSVDMPEMLTSLRQMAGRLIRTVDDRGVVAILDPRLTTKAYGRGVVNALGFPTQRTREDLVTAYLKKIAERRKEQLSQLQQRGESA